MYEDISRECGVNLPESLPDLNEPPFRGSFQQLLYANLGRKVKIDFITGTSGEANSVTGIIEAVSNKFVILKSLCNGNRIVGDNFSIRFITFLC